VPLVAVVLVVVILEAKVSVLADKYH